MSESSKFSLLADFGTVEVPYGYVHSTAPGKFAEIDAEYSNYFNPASIAANLNPSRMLKPGERLRVQAFKQTGSSETSKVDRMDFLHNQGAIYTGVRGAILVFEQKRQLLPEHSFFVSFDELECRLKVAGGCLLTYVCARGVQQLVGDLNSFGMPWTTYNNFLCFTEE